MASIGRSLGNVPKQPTRPQFFIMGGQQAGTTTLYDRLNSSPAFCGASDKEIGFFSKDVFYYQGKKCA